MNHFYDHGLFCNFANAVLGDSKTFYCHAENHWAPGMEKWTVENLGCGISLWTMKCLNIVTRSQSLHVLTKLIEKRIVVCKFLRDCTMLFHVIKY